MSSLSLHVGLPVDIRGLFQLVSLEQCLCLGAAALNQPLP